MPLDTRKFKAVIYLRVSAPDQVLGISLEVQEADCKKYCEEMGFEIVDIFRDEGKSAKTTKREDLQRLLQSCRKHQGKITHVVIWKIDRFARNIMDFFNLKRILSEYGVTIHSATEKNVNTDDVSGRAMQGMLAIFADIDNKIKSDRSVSNMRALLKTGISPFQPPTGYISNQNRKQDIKKRTPDPSDPDRFPIISAGLKEFVLGMHTVNSLNRWMRDKGLMSRSGKPIYPQQTYKILTNPFYAGKIIDPWWNPEIDPPETQIVDGLQVRAIEWNEYLKIQLILAGKSVNAKPRERNNPLFPLRGSAKCVLCGDTVTGSISHGNGGAYPNYHCKKRQCPLYGKSLPKKEVEQGFLELLHTVTPTQESLALFKKVALDVWQTKHKELSTESEIHERNTAKYKAEINELVTMRRRQLITDEEFTEQKQPLDEALAVESVALSDSRIEEWDLEAAINYAVNFITDLPRQWVDYNLEQKQRFQQLVFPDGFIYEKNKGCRTNKLGLIYEVLQNFETSNEQSFDLVVFAKANLEHLINEVKQWRAVIPEFMV